LEEINNFTGMEDSILRVFHRHLAEKVEAFPLKTDSIKEKK
jgi:hypothetical protein